MAVSIEKEFISNFHSLNGITVGERRKSLFNLLNKTQQSLETAIDFTSLQPKTFLEENFKIDALLYFRKVPDLIEALKSENPIVIEKILKADWFIKAAFENISGKHLVTQIFPHLSYNTKLKLINKLSLHLNARKGDEFFEAIKEAYGLYLASKLLPACSDALVIKCIDSNRIEITPRQLLTIIKKYPSLTESIFEKLHEHDTEVNIGSKYKFVFIYLMQHDMPAFFKLNEKYDLEFSLGTRATNKFIRANKESIIKNPKKVYKLLKRKQIGKHIKEDFEDFFVNVFPKSVSDLEENYEDYLSLLNHLQSDAQFKLLQNTYRKMHGSELLDHPGFVTSKTMELMPVGDRELWLETSSRPKEISEEVWVSFMKTEKSIPLLKNKISITSNVKEREKLITSLVTTCKINNDLVGLADVCSYVMSKHRNDHIHIRQEFLRTIKDSFDLRKLSSEHWKYIVELIHLFSINEEWYYESSGIYDSYIHYCLKNDLPIEEQLKFWPKLMGGYSLCQTNPTYEKKCLLMFKDLIQVCYTGKDLEHQHMDYLRYLIMWKKRHPRDKISLFIYSDAINSVKLQLQQESGCSYPADEIAIECIMSDYEKSKEAGLLPLLLNLKLDYYKYIVVIMNWLIKHKPQVLLEFLEPLIRSFANTSAPFNCLSRLFRYYTHLDVSQRASAICFGIIKENKDDIKKLSVMSILSYVMQPSDFLHFASSYYPSDSAADIESAEGQHRYKLQQVIPPCFRHIVPPYHTLQPILNFCKGDYLKLVQKSLYWVAQNVAENRLNPFLDVLIERAVSVRKHAIFLAFKVMDKSKAYSVLTKFMTSDKNPSIRKNLFKTIFNFFLRNSDDHSWELVKETLKAVDVTDIEAFSKLTRCKKIPIRYFVRYFLFTWDILEKLPVGSDKIDEERCQLLEAVTIVKIGMLPKDFCMGIIEKYLFKANEFTNFERKIQCFTCKYLIHRMCKFEPEDVIKPVLHLVKNCVKSADLISHKFVHNLIQEFCSHIKLEKTFNGRMLSGFITSWNDLLQPHEAFNEYLLLQFTQMYLDSEGKIGQKLALLCDCLHNEQLLDLTVFSKSFYSFRTHILLDGKNDAEVKNYDLILAEAILETSDTSNCLLLVLTLLPTEVLIDPKLKAKCDYITDIIAQRPEPLVQIRLRDYLKNKDWK